MKILFIKDIAVALQNCQCKWWISALYGVMDLSLTLVIEKFFIWRQNILGMMNLGKDGLL